MVSVNGTLQLEKKWDFAFLFKNLQEIVNENQVEQAIKFAENALYEAQIQKNAEWTAKFQNTLERLAQIRNLNDNQLQVSKSNIQVIQENIEDLTCVKGIGPTIALKLNSNGFNTLQEIVNSTPERIARIPGIGVVNANKMIINANEYLNRSEVFSKMQEHPTSEPKKLILQERTKLYSQNSKPIISNLNDWFNECKNQERNEKETVSSSLDEESIHDFSSPIPDVETEIRAPEINEKEFEEENPFFSEEDEAKPLRNQVSTSRSTLRVNSDMNRTDRNELRMGSRVGVPEMENPLIKLQETGDGSMSKINRDSIPETPPEIERNQFYQQISSIIKVNQFHEIPLNRQDMKEFQRGIDFLGCKIITVSNNSRLIMLIPIKYYFSRNYLIVSEKRILKHLSTNEASSLKYVPDSITEAHARQLKKVSDTIFESFTSKGTLFTLLSKYLGLEILVQRGIKQKPLFVTSGDVEYKIIIDPILITNQSFSSIEKTIPFPYQYSSNIHFIELEELQELIEYLEQKYTLLMTQGSSSNALIKQLEMKNSFYRNAKNYSLPFLGFGALFSLFLVMQMGDLVRLFTSLGFALIFIYLGAITLVFYRYFQATNNMTIQFKTPHYEKRYVLPKEDLILIREDFSEEWMTQLEYEVTYRSVEKPVKLEKNNFTAFLSKKSIYEPKKEKVTMINDQGNHKPFETEALTIETEFEREEDLNQNDPVLSKYQSFLDD